MVQSHCLLISLANIAELPDLEPLLAILPDAVVSEPNAMPLGLTPPAGTSNLSATRWRSSPTDTLRSLAGLNRLSTGRKRVVCCPSRLAGSGWSCDRG